jgi:peptidoglycan L-alanyl-D-glutamate endopeptidase CwlK
VTLTIEEICAKSAPNIVGLYEGVRQAAEELVKRCYLRGVNIRITQGLRTIAEQDALYAQGRTKPGAKVTNARGGYSNHNFGVAIDFVLMASGYNMKADANNNGQADWYEVVEEAKKLGFAWGGDWVSFVDYPHFEMTFGLSTADYRAGKRPTQAQINAVLAKINATKGEDGAMTIEEKAAFKTLHETVTSQAKRLEVLEARDKMAKVPAWAEAACIAAKKAGAIDTANDGSYDFYRVITVMYRRGFFGAVDAVPVKEAK